MFVDGKLVLDRWRQNWGAWYHNFDVVMTAGIPVAVEIEWTPNDSYIALLHNDPLAQSERNSLTFTSDGVARSTTTSLPASPRTR